MEAIGGGLLGLGVRAAGALAAGVAELGGLGEGVGALAEGVNESAEDESIFTRPDGVPDDWIEKPSNKGDGVKFVDPNNDGTYVRIMPGNPDSQFSNSQSPYVSWQVNGQTLDIEGNFVSRDTSDAHIPLTDFQFNPKVLK